MGTSKGYGGPASGLVPSFVDDPLPPVRPKPSAVPPSAPSAPGIPGATPSPPESPMAPPSVPTSPPAGTLPPPDRGPGEFGGARSKFTRFARTGSRGSLGGALSDYVRKGTGNARRAARRMGASRTTAEGLLGIVRDFQTIGPTETLRQLDLAALAGAPAAEVFVALMEFVCPPGGAVDDAIARQAMLESIGDMAEVGVGSFDALTPQQMQDFFLDFVARSIEGRVMADLGSRGIRLPDDVTAVEYAQTQLHDFVTGATRSELAGKLDNVARLSDRDIRGMVDQIYETGFELVAAAGAAAA